MPSDHTDGDPFIESIYEDLRKLGVNIEAIKRLSPTREQLIEFRDSIRQMMLDIFKKVPNGPSSV